MWKKNQWTTHPWIMKFLIASVVFPQIANITGWWSACFGRQPWVVYKLLKTKDGYSTNVSPTEAMISLVMFVFVYVSLLVLFLYLLNKKIKHGPTTEDEDAPYRD